MHNIFWIHNIACKQRFGVICMDYKITVRIDEVLKEREQSLYWLARTTGISYTTLWRLTKDRAAGVNFATLEKMSIALNCQPGDLMDIEPQKKRKPKTRAISARSTRRLSSHL